MANYTKFNDLENDELCEWCMIESKAAGKDVQCPYCKPVIKNLDAAITVALKTIKREKHGKQDKSL